MMAMLSIGHPIMEDAMGSFTFFIIIIKKKFIIIKKILYNAFTIWYRESKYN